MRKRLVQDFAKQLGYEIVPAWRMRRLAMARHLSAIFEAYGVEAAVDVGANDGQYRDFLRSEVGFAGPVLSYEPQPACFARLTARAREDSAWLVRNLALGERTSYFPLNIMSDSQFSSFRTPGAGAPAEFVEPNRVREVVTVPVRRLDEELSDPELPAPFRGRLYLKLDTQGFDLAVLRGGSGVMARIVALQSELSFKPIYEGMPSFAEAVEYLHGLGFDLSGLFPVSNDRHMALVEADGVFVNPARFGRRGDRLT